VGRRDFLAVAADQPPTNIPERQCSIERFPQPVSD
jgi:hypothetical protein